MTTRYRLISLAAALLLVLACGTARAVTNFNITLSGAQETPPIITAASGSGTAVLNDAQTELTINYTFSGLGSPQTAAHVHSAPVGVPGGVVKPLPMGNVTNFIWSSSDGSAPLTAALVGTLMAEGLYVNIHSTQFPGGELRGQIVLAPVPVEGSTWGRIKTLF